MAFKRLDPEDFVVSADSITAPAWSNYAPNLANMYTSSVQVAGTSGNYYVNIYQTSSTDSSAEIQFNIAYGHKNGSGSLLYNAGIDGLSPTRTVYGQFRNLIYGDENAEFLFNGIAQKDFYSLTIDRARYKQSLFPGSLNLTLNSGSFQIVLTDNSNDVSIDTYLDCGRVYDIVSGSNGTTFAGAPSTAATGKLGFYLPDVGVIILNPKALIGAGIIANFTPVGNTNERNYQRIYTALVAGSFVLNSYETVSSDYVFVRVPNNEFNYTTNPSIVSGSGALLFPTLINNPQSYMTTVGLYNDNQELLAVAKLSKPLVKDFTKEALIQVKLNW
jgi:hypothetical protein